MQPQKILVHCSQTNLKNEGDKKFDVSNQYLTLEIAEWKTNRNIVATLANDYEKVTLEHVFLDQWGPQFQKKCTTIKFPKRKKSMTINKEK